MTLILVVVVVIKGVAFVSISSSFLFLSLCRTQRDDDMRRVMIYLVRERNDETFPNEKFEFFTAF